MFRLNQLALSALTSLFFASLLMEPTRGQVKFTGVKNVVLVHGAYADGFSYSKVIPQLHA